MKQVRTATAFALVVDVGAASATADDKTSERQEMLAEHKAMREAWKRRQSPCRSTRGWLARWGSRGSRKFWMDPTKPPTESVGTVERELMLGGRVLAEKLRTTYMDKPTCPRSSGAPGTTTWAPGSC